MLSGSNEGTTHKGYLHWGQFYKGKLRERPTAFSLFGKGYEMVMLGILGMDLRYMGYWVIMDSWFTGLPLLQHGRLWGVNMGGTIRHNRVGLDSKENKSFAEESKKLKKTFRKEKPEKGGYVRGHWTSFSAPKKPLVVSVVKDSKVFLGASNAVSSHQ